MKCFLHVRFILMLLLVGGVIHSIGQTASEDLVDLLNTPYVSELTVSDEQNLIAFSVNQAGSRNVYIAGEKLGKMPIRLTQFNSDDGQEITSLKFTPDGAYLVFARGGDHGANSSPRAVNPASMTQPAEIAVYAVKISSREVIRIDAGDFPVTHPSTNVIVYSKSFQLWQYDLDSRDKPKPLFHAKGSVSGAVWAPGGKTLAFVSRRGTHSFVGLFNTDSDRIAWVMPSFHRDHAPRWSPKGDALVFIRQRAIGGTRDSLTARRNDLWQIIRYDLSNAQDRTLYSSADRRQDAYPRIGGGPNLQWPAEDFVTFVSYRDGWPHLYRLSAAEGDLKQITKGNFEVRQFDYSKDGISILFSANAGTDEDIDRSHIGIADIAKGTFKMVTKGTGIEATPLFFQQNQIAFLQGGVREPFRPVTMELRAGKKTEWAADLFNPSLYKNFVEPQLVRFIASDGIEVTGQLYSNVRKTEKGKRPAVVYIHGGPRRQMYLGWHPIDYYHYDYITNQYLAGKGIDVLVVNYRMGTGYGFDFQHPDQAGTLGASEYEDILAAGKWLASRKHVDTNRIGLFGGSYGGYLTAMGLAKNSDLFAFGVDIHGVHNREKPRNLEFYPPDYEIASEIAWQSSPSKFVDQWKSPVLIIHGDDDQNVPFAQSIDLVNRLIDQGVEVELMALPDENHHWMLHENLLQVKKATVDYLIRKAHAKSR